MDFSLLGMYFKWKVNYEEFFYVDDEKGYNGGSYGCVL